MQKEQENAMDKHTLERKCAMMEYTMYVPPRLRSAGPECRAAGASSCRQWAPPPAPPVRLPVRPGGLSPWCGGCESVAVAHSGPSHEAVSSPHPLSKTKKNRLPKFKKNQLLKFKS